MKYVKFFSLILITLMLFNCSTIQTQVDYDRRADFSSYKTYSFHEKGLQQIKLNDIDKSRILNAISSNLQAKGFTQVTSNPDFIINLSAFNKDKVDVSYNSYGFGWNWFYFGYNDPIIHQYKEGSLMVDIVDAQKNLLVWQGVASGIYLDKLEIKEEQLPEAINKVLLKFPPQNK